MTEQWRVPHHESDTFTHIDGLLYKHAMDASQKFLALVIPKSWHFMVPVEVHDKLGHQRVMKTYYLIKQQGVMKMYHLIKQQGVVKTYHLIKQHYYWKQMNKDINKYIANCTLCRREKVKAQMYPLYIPENAFDKIAIDLIIDLNI